MTVALIPPVLEEDQHLAALRGEVRNFLAEFQNFERFAPKSDGWVSSWNPEFSRALADRGLLGMSIPVAYGGRGRSPIERHVVVEELLAAGAPVAYHWFADRQMAPALLRYGTEKQRNEYLPRIAAGHCSFAIGLSESDAGSDLAAVRTSAKQVDGGWVISGTKLWTSNAHRADVISVLARTASFGEANRHEGLSQFLIDLPHDDVTVRPVLQMGGEHHFNEVQLNEVFVPDTQVLGTPGQGWQQVTSELAWERSGPERFLSSFPVLAAAMDAIRSVPSETTLATLGYLFSQLWTLRKMSLAVAHALANGTTPHTAAALVKDVGTSFEGNVLEAIRSIVADAAIDQELVRPMLDDTLRKSPGFTIRGGTTEVLRGIVAKELSR